MKGYLDWAATSIPDPEIIDKTASAAKKIFANPSSKHSEGIKAKELLDKSRKICASALSVPEKNIIFTSGGTESNNIAVLSLLRKKKRGKILISAIEHPAVSEPCRILKESGFKVVKINPDIDGIVKPESVIKHLDNDVQFVSVMLVNNETGAIQRAAEIAASVKQFASENSTKIYFHCDAVQGTGKVKFNFSDKNIDSISVSSHKFSGPRGAGILIVNTSVLPLLSGGGQESGIRPGTENLASIYGMSLALKKTAASIDERGIKSKKLLSLLYSHLTEIKGGEIIPSSREIDDSRYSPYILNITFPPVPAEVLTRILSDRGFCISSGSACSSINKKHSDTLLAMKIDNKKAFSAVRISTGYTTTEEDIEAFCSILREEVEKLVTISR
jgi:cysteine desulfurase